MFFDYMLKFESQQEAETVLLGLNLLQENEGNIMPAFGANVDIIGTIYKPDGTFTTTEEGFQMANHAPLDGYHVNVRSTGEIQSLDAYKVTPATPYRVWA